jgi:hypothetical protein
LDFLRSTTPKITTIAKTVKMMIANIFN